MDKGTCNLHYEPFTLILYLLYQIYPSLLILLFNYTTYFLGLAYYFFLGLGLILIIILGIWAYLYLGHVLLYALAWPA